MRSFRFLHAADIHLDSPLRGLDLGDSAIADRVRAAPRAAFRNLVRYAIEEQIDFLVIAGDLYDGDWKDFRTGLFFVEQMGHLNAAGVPVFVLYGNHDAKSEITRKLTLPDNVRVFSSYHPQSYPLEELDVVLHGRSFPNRAVPENLARSYPDPVEGAFNIGVLHTSLAGHADHDTYAPCTREDLVAKGYDYWALGHIHTREVLHERPWIAFSGNLQGRHPRETGPKGAYLATVTDGVAERPTFLELDVVRWEVVPVPVAGLETVEDIWGAVSRAAAQARQAAGDRPLVCRVRIEGRTAAHTELLADPEQVLNEVRAATAGLGGEPIAVERVEVHTHPPEDPDAVRSREDAVGQLLELIRAGADAEEGPEEMIKGIMAVFRDRVSASVQDTEDPPLRAVLDRDWPALVAAVRPYVEARIRRQRS